MIQATGFHRGRRLGVADIVDANGMCPVCHSAQARRAVYRIQRDPDIAMLECSMCGAASASHMPKPEVLQRYYAEYYAGADQQHTLDDPMRFAQHVLRAMPDQPRSTSVRILDFGGGDGSLSLAIARCLQARRAGLAVAIDLVDYGNPREPDLPQVAIHMHRDLAMVTDGCDIILASAIFEHIPDAYSVIRDVTARASSNAYMYARTPFVLPMARMVPAIDITYPGHVHDMGARFWRDFVKTFGLRASTLSSRPSLVETTLQSNPIRTILAHTLKAPALMEQSLFRGGRLPHWKFVGGWEAVIRFD